MTVYFDHNASSPLLPEALEVMLPLFSGRHGNASSLHGSGRLLRSAIESARDQVARLVGVGPQQVIFTSGGTEANNLALKGTVDACASPSLMSSPIEHASLLEPLRQLQGKGAQLSWLEVDAEGRVVLEGLAERLAEARPEWLSLQRANNETGVLQPVAEVAEIARRQGVRLLHCDATQAAGKIPLDFNELGVDLMTLSAHKFGGPQGMGALVARPGLKLEALLAGGPQEQQRRAGTENAALIAGFGKAAEMAQNQLPERQAFLLELRTHFEARLKEIDGVVIFGEAAERLPNTCFFAIPFYHGETLLMELDKAGFALASGSACHSEVTRPSHVLTAMGVDEDLALNAVRASFGMENSLQQVDRLIDALHNRINQLPPALRQHSG